MLKPFACITPLTFYLQLCINFTELLRDMILKRPKAQDCFLFLSLALGMSIMYSAYFYNMTDAAPNQSPGYIRTSLKCLAVLFFIMAYAKRFTFAALLRNYALKLPIIFIGAVTLFVSPFLLSDELQAINIIFFLPLLAFDWDTETTQKIFRKIWLMIVIICLVQVILDPILKFTTSRGFDNLALIGGIGNANNFGYWLLSCAIFSKLILKNSLLFWAFCFFATFTGSLVILVLIGTIFIGNALGATRHMRSSNFLWLAILIATLIVLFRFLPADYDFGNAFRAVNHAAGKFLAFLSVIGSNGSLEAGSVSSRVEYIQEGLWLIAQHPFSLVVGHPNGRPMYTGDGWWLGLLVTHGAIVTGLFLVSNVIIVVRGFKFRCPETWVCSIIVALTCIMFLANRLLDYWPAAFLYFLSVGLICNHHPLTGQFSDKKVKAELI
jgi:hypothetical protein